MDELDFTGGDDTDDAIHEHQNLGGMYADYFLDYASYVIMERAVPHLSDGLKPVQRRILHSMRELEDGRYNKVANVVGNTMKYHSNMAIRFMCVRVCVCVRVRVDAGCSP